MYDLCIFLCALTLKHTQTRWNWHVTRWWDTIVQNEYKPKLGLDKQRKLLKNSKLKGIHKQYTLWTRDRDYSNYSKLATSMSQIEWLEWQIRELCVCFANLHGCDLRWSHCGAGSFHVVFHLLNLRHEELLSMTELFSRLRWVKSLCTGITAPSLPAIFINMPSTCAWFQTQLPWFTECYQTQS